MSGINLLPIKPVKANPIMKAIDLTFHIPKKFRIEAVNDCLFRSSDVPIERIPFLSGIGVQRVVNLRTISTETAEKLAGEYKKYGIEFFNVPANFLNFKKSIPTLLRFVKEAADKKTLFHCTYGKHRTGGAIALGRSVLEGLPMPEAIDDMYKHGFKSIHKFFICSVKHGLQKFEKTANQIST